MSNLIRRQDAIDLIEQFYAFESKSEQIALQIAMRDLPSAQPERKECEEREQGKCRGMQDDAINRQQAIRWVKTECNPYGKPTLEFESGKKVIEYLEQMPSAQPEIVRCKNCKFWHSGSCECPEHAVNCQDYYVGDIETEAEYFCGYAERREVTT